MSRPARMICAYCGEPSVVVEERADRNHTLRRRRECSQGHSFLTYEVHGHAFTPNHQRLRRYAATIARRVEQWRRDQQIALDFATHGWRFACEKWGLAQTTVYLAVRRAKNYSRSRLHKLSDREQNMQGSDPA